MLTFPLCVPTNRAENGVSLMGWKGSQCFQSGLGLETCLFYKSASWSSPQRPAEQPEAAVQEVVGIIWLSSSSWGGEGGGRKREEEEEGGGRRRRKEEGGGRRRRSSHPALLSADSSDGRSLCCLWHDWHLGWGVTVMESLMWGMGGGWGRGPGLMLCDWQAGLTTPEIILGIFFYASQLYLFTGISFYIFKSRFTTRGSM